MTIYGARLRFADATDCVRECHPGPIVRFEATMAAARTSTLGNPRLAETVMSTVAHVLAIDPREVHLSSDLARDLGADMLTGPLVWLALEAALDVDLNGEFETDAQCSVFDLLEEVTRALVRNG